MVAIIRQNSNERLKYEKDNEDYVRISHPFKRKEGTKDKMKTEKEV